MKRIIALAAIVTLSIAAAYADDGETKKAFAVSAGPIVTLGITGAFAGGQAQFIWKPGLFGIAAGVRAEANLSVPDIYVIPNAGVRLGWFGLEGGAGIRVNDGLPGAGFTEVKLETVVPFIRAGLSIPIGPLSIDVGARVMPTDSYTDIEVDSLGEAIAAPFVVAIIAVLGFVKFDAGLSYVYRF